MEYTVKRIKVRRRGCPQISAAGALFVIAIGVIAVLAAVEIARAALPVLLCFSHLLPG